MVVVVTSHSSIPHPVRGSLAYCRRLTHPITIIMYPAAVAYLEILSEGGLESGPSNGGMWGGNVHIPNRRSLGRGEMF